jgi:hypothetical protein
MRKPEASRMYSASACAIIHIVIVDAGYFFSCTGHGMWHVAVAVIDINKNSRPCAFVLFSYVVIRISVFVDIGMVVFVFMCITGINLITITAPALRIYKHMHMRAVNVDVAVGVAW